jgi:hypothetical protein
MPQNWTKMTSEEKIEMLTAVLSAAAINMELRDRLLESPESAMAAMREEQATSGNVVDFPPDFQIKFISAHDTATTTDSVLMRIPQYYPNLIAPPIKIEDHLLCTYNYWKDIPGSQQGALRERAQSAAKEASRRRQLLGGGAQDAPN